jgi:poly [ADP-ribose] polymerase 2/3/4
MFVKVAAAANNNKFYEWTLHSDGTVTGRYGRVGYEGTIIQGGHGSEAFEAKKRERLKKSYKPVDIIGTNTGSGAGASRSTLEREAVRALSFAVPTSELTELVKRLVMANKHHIETTSGGKITVSDTGGVTTPLGAVSADSITQARGLLSQLATSPDSVNVIEEYLTLVPQSLGMGRGWETMFRSADVMSKQREFLDQLDGAVAIAASMAVTSPTGTTEPLVKFRYQLEPVATTDDRFLQVQKFYKDTSNASHVSARKRLVAIYRIVDNAESFAAWKNAQKTLRNTRELWHGTSDHNMLSILHRGLYVPPTRGSTIHIAGRMFGDGIYLSDQSTKSLNYSTGFWGGGNSGTTTPMLLTNTVMGHEMRPTAQHQALTRGTDPSNGKTYNSIFVRGGTCRVRNNEMIVWDTTQINLGYLCLFS